MLVLSRKQGQRIVVGNGITVTVVLVRGSGVKLGFDGPPEIPIYREEVQRRPRRACRGDGRSGRETAPIARWGNPA